MIKPYRIGIKELVDRDTYNKHPEDDLWRLLDPRLLHTLDALRRYLGYVMIINTWSFRNWQRWGSNPFSYRGFRPVGCGVGAITGAHYQGMAADIDFYKDGQRVEPKEAINLILDNIHLFPYIRGMEINVNWVHVDVMGEAEAPSSRVGILPGKVLMFDPYNRANNYAFEAK